MKQSKKPMFSANLTMPKTYLAAVKLLLMKGG